MNWKQQELFPEEYVKKSKAKDFIKTLKDDSVDLFLIDPPYYKIVDDDWDNKWKNEKEYVEDISSTVFDANKKLKKTGSFIIFSGIGSHGCHPIHGLYQEIEKFLINKNTITWKKKRAYGKSNDYLFCREEILWFVKQENGYTFNIPYLEEKRGYDGYNKKYPAKSEYKRVSNVWDDINEIFSPERKCQKPLKLLRRLIETHSNPGDLIVDFYAGTGTTGIAALDRGRKFIGCDEDEGNEKLAEKANEKCAIAFSNFSKGIETKDFLKKKNQKRNEPA